jgi:hypothetical protein
MGLASLLQYAAASNYNGHEMATRTQSSKLDMRSQPRSQGPSAGVAKNVVAGGSQECCRGGHA